MPGLANWRAAVCSCIYTAGLQWCFTGQCGGQTGGCTQVVGLCAKRLTTSRTLEPNKSQIETTTAVVFLADALHGMWVRRNLNSLVLTLLCQCCAHHNCSFCALQVLDNGRRLHLGEAAEATRSALSGIIKNVTSALKLPFQGGQHGAGGPPVDLSDEPQIQTSGPSMQPLTSQPQADALPAGTSIRVSVRAPSDADAKPMESRLAGAGTLVDYFSCSVFCHASQRVLYYCFLFPFFLLQDFTVSIVQMG